jgi:hypothetical protein
MFLQPISIASYNAQDGLDTHMQSLSAELQNHLDILLLVMQANFSSIDSLNKLKIRFLLP